ncbi:MAG: sel1 repeat family protein, partial [Lachnospiraceae bacterium]|nr:sel1 repeat family protein [Lachnospiraceae bacterium]
IPLLRICKRLDKNSELYKKTMGVLYDRHAIPWCSGIDRYLIDVYPSKGQYEFWTEYPLNRNLANKGNEAERRCDKEKIIDTLKNVKDSCLYFTPWKVHYVRAAGEPWEDIFDTYPAELKSRILEMYLEIAYMDIVSPLNKRQIHAWDSSCLIKQPYIDDHVKVCCLLKNLGQKEEDKRRGFLNVISGLTHKTAEESLFVLKRLEGYDVQEAYYGLGIKYLEGLGCERDYQEARRYFVKGSNCDSEEERKKCKGMVSYATRKADCYEFFKIAMKKLESEQFEEGIKRLEKLAEEEDLEEAQVELAKLLETGYKIKKDEERAMKNYERAAESGNKEAMKKVLQKLEKEYDRLTFRNGHTYERECIRKEISKWKYRLENTYCKDYKTK